MDPREPRTVDVANDSAPMKNNLLSRYRCWFMEQRRRVPWLRVLWLAMASVSPMATGSDWVTETPHEFLVTGRFQAGSAGNDLLVVDKVTGLARVGWASADGWTWVEQAMGMTGISALTTLRRGAQDEIAASSAAWNAVQVVAVGGIPRTLPSPVVAPRGMVRLTTGHTVNAVEEDLLVFSDVAEAPDQARFGALTGAGNPLFEAWAPAFPESAQFVPVSSPTGIPVLVSVQHGVLRVDFVGRTGVLEGGFPVSSPHPGGLLWAGTPPSLFSIARDSVNLEEHRMVVAPVGGALSYPAGLAETLSHTLPERVVGLDTVPFTDPAFPTLRCLVAVRLASTPEIVRLYRLLDAPVSAVELAVLEAPAGEGFAGLLTVGDGFVLWSGPGGRAQTWRRYAQAAAGEVPRLVESGTVPTLRSRAAQPNLFWFDQDPFLAEAAVLKGSETRPDWTTVTTLGAWAEFDGGVTDGLGTMQAFAINAPGRVAIGNQLLPGASVAGFGAVGSPARSSVTFSPPSGAYGELAPGKRFQVTLRSSAVGEVIRYRITGAEAWVAYDPARPPELTANGSIMAFAEDPASGVRSTMETARYTFNRLPAPVPAVAVDADGDGLGDAWEKVFGIEDPTSDTDGDGASALAEYRRGTDPRDAGSRPSDTPSPDAEIAVVNLQDGRIQLSWPAELQGYVVEWSTDLAVWTPVTPQPAGNSWSEAVGGLQKFYRLRGN